MVYTKENIQKKKRQKEKIKEVISIIVYIIVIPLLCYNISLIVQALVNPDETPSFFGVKTYVIVSGSMEPELEIGDMIVVKSVDTSELEVGDIISFRQGQSVITHRISEIITNEDGEIEYKTKGDNNNAEDSGSITGDLIEGKVVSVVPLVGKLAILLQNKIVIITIILIIYFYFSRTGKRKRKREERRRKRLIYEYEQQVSEIDK